MKPIYLTKREKACLDLCNHYARNPFGHPTHLLMILVVKLWMHMQADGGCEVIEEAER